MSLMTDQQIQNFVAAWYQALDFHLPIAQVYPMLAADGLVMSFPDGDINDYASFKVWYDRVTNIFFDENHFVNEVKISPQGGSFSWTSSLAGRLPGGLPPPPRASASQWTPPSVGLCGQPARTPLAWKLFRTMPRSSRLSMALVLPGFKLLNS